MGKVLIGWAEESIMPENKKISLAGQFYERISDHVESDITTTAMAVESDGDYMIMASVDVVGMTPDARDLAREKFADLCPELDPRKLIINVTHTHTSLRLAAVKKKKESKDVGFDTPRSILAEFMPVEKQYKALVTRDDTVLSDEEGTDFVTTKIALAAKTAWENRKESLYTNEFGRAAVGMCRRVTYDDGSAQMWGDVNCANFVALEGGNDSGIELIFTFDTNKKLTGIVANIACPSQVLEHRSFVSSDYWGETKKLLRAKFGDEIFLLALCGAGGDQCPRDLVRWVNGETPVDDPNISRPNYFERKADPSMFDLKGCRLIARRIATEIFAVYEEITELKDEAVLKHKVIDLDLPLRKATMEQYKEAVREIEYYVEKNKDKDFTFEDTARMHVYAGTIKRFREQQNKEVYPIEYHVVRFGDVAFATNPFELFLDFGNYMKARSKCKQTFIVQLCCGAGGYLPTEKAEKGGHYSAYISSGNVGHEGGDLLARETVTEINKMFED